MSISVSVIIPVYNVEQYLAPCIDSVLCQSLENIEIICVNDCSSDNSLKILNSYAGKDNRLTIINHKINSGLAAARNSGLDQSTGEYLFFLDSDDLLFSKQSLATLYALAKKDNVDEAIGAMLRWNEKTEERQRGYHANYTRQPLNSVLFKNAQYLRSNVTACNKLLRISFLNKHNLRFNTNLKKFEDNSFSWKVHLLAQSISLTPQVTYLHRQRSSGGPQSIMQCKKNNFKYHTIAAGDILDFLNNMPNYTDLRHNFDRYFFYWLQEDANQANKESPDIYKKKEVLGRYLPLLENIPEASLEVLPERYREILLFMKTGKLIQAWQTLINKPEQAAVDNKQIDEIKTLKAELDAVYHSTSWRITAPCRGITEIIKKYHLLSQIYRTMTKKRKHY